MKSGCNEINIFLLYILIPLGNAFNLLDFNYPSAIGLLNKNVFIVEKEGIFVYDEQLKNIIYSHPFQDPNDKIDNEVKLSKVVIRFRENYIICLINRKIFFFDQEGKELLLESETIIPETNYYYPDLIPIVTLHEKINNYYYYYFYVITYLSSNGDSFKQELIFCKVDTYNKSNIKIKSLIVDEMEDDRFAFFDNYYSFLNKGLSCEYMQSDNDEKVYNYLACFFIIDDNG